MTDLPSTAREGVEIMVGRPEGGRVMWGSGGV